MTISFGPRRAEFVDIGAELAQAPPPLTPEDIEHREAFDLLYRSLCALLFNYVPTSGHPGGSISSGRFVTSVLFGGMDYDFSQPDRPDADIISYAAGHKAMGLYALWALRNETVRIGAPHLLPKDVRYQLRLEDLLGFRRNPVTQTPLFRRFGAKALDGHPTPATPFVKLSTGASGVGVASSLGLALGAVDYYGAQAPYVHIVEGEGGLTPGRVHEALAAAGTMSLWNAVLHLDWNQASIDSNRVCREGTQAGDYVQWDPMEFFHLHDWNVAFVPDGSDFQQVVAAQRRALSFTNGQPTAVVYRTIKGWRYGIEGKSAHGAGHKFCSDKFIEAMAPLLQEPNPAAITHCEPGQQLCQGGKDAATVEACFWEALQVVRQRLEENQALTGYFCSRLLEARDRLQQKSRKPRPQAPAVERIYQAASSTPSIPADCALKPGEETTLRGQLGRLLSHYNKLSQGALLTASADLLGSTSVDLIAQGLGDGFFNSRTNPGARLLATGGICEDAMAGILSGLAAFGHHLGVGSSYAAFLAPLAHIAARLRAIGSQARQALAPEPYKPFFLVCAHAGVKTGEDGPTHADPQPLQLLQGNFPRGTMITLTPWDPQEIWWLVAAALRARPAVIVPFVTRPTERVLDRSALGLADASQSRKGVYRMLESQGKPDVTVVLQESGVTYAFVTETLPLLRQAGIDAEAYYVSSSELYDLLPEKEREEIFPESAGQAALGITGFTLPTMFRWIRSARGQAATLHPFQRGHFLGSGQADTVLAEAGLDGHGQFNGIKKFLGR
jgi:transketolase